MRLRTPAAPPSVARLALLASLGAGLVLGVQGPSPVAAAAQLTPAPEARGALEAADSSAADPLPADLDDLRAHPLRYRGVPVAVTVQLGDEREAWRAGLTRFDPRRFRSFAAWSDEARLWHPEPYADPFPGLFVRRGTPAAGALAGSGSYGRLELVVVLRGVFGGETWVEVLEARRLPRSVGEGTLIHASRAVGFTEDGHLEAAVEEYARALAAPLPDGHRAALEEERDRAQRKLKAGG